jgi:hypothetical protein
MRRRSSSVKRPGLVSTSIGIRILPMSCSRPATPIARTSRGRQPIDSESAIASTDTFNECVVVY